MFRALTFSFCLLCPLTWALPDTVFTTQSPVRRILYSGLDYEEANFIAIKRETAPAATQKTQQEAPKGKLLEVPLTIESLVKAARNGRYEEMAYLLQSGVSPNALSPFGIAPLHAATQAGKLLAVDALLKAGADVNLGDKRQNTPLHIAVQFNNLALVRPLLEAGANLNAKNKDGQTPLFVAVNKQNAILTDVFLRLGADVDAKDLFQQTPLLAAVRKKNIPLMRQLIDAGSNINTRDATAQTPLLAAIANSSPYAVVELLLENGANVAVANRNNQRPIDIAIAKGRLDLANLMMGYE